MTVEYRKPIKLTAYNNGYVCFYDKEHPLATTDGRVFYHRHVASLMYGRWLDTSDHVHHIDGDKNNNDSSNLVVTNASEHQKLHKPKMYDTDGICAVCKKAFVKPKELSLYCSQHCYNLSRVKDSTITKELLDSLIPKYSWVALGKMLGYSDNGIKKRAKALGCNINKKNTSVS